MFFVFVDARRRWGGDGDVGTEMGGGWGCGGGDGDLKGGGELRLEFGAGAVDCKGISNGGLEILTV